MQFFIDIFTAKKEFMEISMYSPNTFDLISDTEISVLKILPDFYVPMIFLQKEFFNIFVNYKLFF